MPQNIERKEADVITPLLRLEYMTLKDFKYLTEGYDPKTPMKKIIIA